MTRRRGHVTIRCAAPGCVECGVFELPTSEREGCYRCIKHSAPPGELLSPTQTTTLSRLVLRRLAGTGDCLFWCRDGKEYGSGFAHGPGFQAHGEDFPEGTVLEVTARVVLPAEGR